MIGLIQGKVSHLSAPFATIMTVSGIGYEVELPVPSFCQLQLDIEIKIWTHLHVREDAQLLYGFIDYKERDVFRQLIKINGVGAKMALAMLSNMSSSQLKICIEEEDDIALTRIPGIGKKTAQRLLIELKDKLKHVEFYEDGADNKNTSTYSNNNRMVSEVESALISLGYREKEAQQAIKLANALLEQPSDIQTLLKASLKQLA